MSDAIRNAFADIFREPEPLTCSLLVKTTLHSDTPLVLFHLARELRIPFVYGLNYLNVRDSPRKLRRWYPILSRWILPEASHGAWRELPQRRPVSRERLVAMMEWVSAGHEGEEGFSQFPGMGAEATEDSNQRSAPRQPEVGLWEPRRQVQIVTPMEPISILPELETVYAFIERVPRVPTLFIVDSIDALAAHYGIKPIEIAKVLVSDLVDRGVANQILVTEALGSSVLDLVVDGIVQLVPHDNPRCLEWHLEIDRLPDGRRPSEKYTLRIEDDRIRSSASHHDLVNVLTRGGSFFRSGLPTNLLESLGGLAFPSGRPPATSEENVP